MRHLESEPPMIRIDRILAATVVAMSAALTTAHAQGPTPNACAAPDRHKFDFWIGEWDVKVSAGATVGKSSVQSIAGGCGLLENWTAGNGSTGKSLNAYNPATKQWQQYWVGQGGAVTEYRESTWNDGSLSYIARGSAPNGPPIQRLRSRRSTTRPSVSTASSRPTTARRGRRRTTFTITAGGRRAPTHSARSAWTGSAFAARHAGTSDATVAIVSSALAATVIANGSLAETP